MQWNHLPVAGGLYDQHPKLLEEFLYIFSVKSKHEQEKMDKEKRDAESKNRRAGRTPKKGRRR